MCLWQCFCLFSWCQKRSMHHFCSNFLPNSVLQLFRLATVQISNKAFFKMRKLGRLVKYCQKLSLFFTSLTISTFLTFISRQLLFLILFYKYAYGTRHGFKTQLNQNCDNAKIVTYTTQILVEKCQKHEQNCFGFTYFPILDFCTPKI